MKQNSYITIEKMHSGDLNTIIDGIESGIPILVMNAIISGVQHSILIPRFIDGMKRMKNNSITLLNIRIGDVAVAGLDILGVEPYLGTDRRIKEYIHSKLV